MTDTAQRIMDLFKQHKKVQPGMVVTVSELSSAARQWGGEHAAALEKAMAELEAEGYVIITSPHGLELTEEGYDRLMNG